MKPIKWETSKEDLNLMKLEKYTKVVICLFETRINEKSLFILQGFFFQYCALNMHVFAYMCVCLCMR